MKFNLCVADVTGLIIVEVNKTQMIEIGSPQGHSAHYNNSRKHRNIFKSANLPSHSRGLFMGPKKGKTCQILTGLTVREKNTG